MIPDFYALVKPHLLCAPKHAVIFVDFAEYRPFWKLVTENRRKYAILKPYRYENKEDSEKWAD